MSKKTVSLPSFRRALPGIAAMAVLTVAAACNPPAVNPDGVFTVRGSLEDADGFPAANTDFHLLKLDLRLDTKSRYLNGPTVPGTEQPFQGFFVGRSTSDGSFSMELRGDQVNRNDGGGAAFLALLYESQGSSINLMATRTEWEFFSDNDPVWDVGTVKLWKGGSATQIAAQVDFNLSGAPQGNTRDTSQPSFVSVYPVGGDLAWASHTLGSRISVARSAFAAGASPEFFMTTSSRENGGSRTYRHRSGYRTVAGWQTTNNSSNYVSRVEDDTGGAMTGAYDNDKSTTFAWPSGVQAKVFHIDLATHDVFRDILIYNLGVENFGNARVSVSIATGHTASTVPTIWTEMDSQLGHDGFDGEEIVPWLYTSTSNAQESVLTRWIKVQVDNKSFGVGAPAHFKFVGEVEVRY